MSVVFTDRELKNAWRELSKVSTPPANEVRSNPHRLLLFYAVECGLKAIWLKRQSRTLFENKDISDTGHNLQKILRELRVGSNLELQQNLHLEPVNQDNKLLVRNGSISDLHQIWRYGGKCEKPNDQDYEQQLQKVLDWIKGELR